MIDNLNKRPHLKDKRLIDFQVITEPEFLETVETPLDESDSDSGVIEVQSVQVNEKATMLVDVDVGVTMDGFCLFSQVADGLDTFGNTRASPRPHPGNLSFKEQWWHKKSLIFKTLCPQKTCF